ncbi:AMP-binding protein [Arthrobacter sp. zg-Y916]|uniref:AMP-binding protein n=1 Tax=Arthrobacter caoxuetaonis TaxID=2886935 RepID=A0A9X1SBC5_9MICC|nr:MULTISPECIES: AMP-binding protein [Arthrobacter]MCC3296381.1 AMP-binding protein [Arthrobacter caoxuetaonis]MCC9192457.1 AMP-binding protein [Arthrobacter sp. zg-Y916]USQ56778.1 AMP-binding protein [Arthrobacter caoxuetaonis]
MELLPVHTPAGFNAGDLLPPLAAALAGEGPAVAPHADPAQTFTGELPNDDIALVISTSGSTGTPKQTMLSTDALAASSMATAMHLGRDGQWLLALPVHYIAGVQVLVRSLFAGTEPVLLDTGSPFSPEAFTTAAQAMTDRTRLTSLVPTQLHRLLTDPAEDTLSVLRRFDTILLGGAAASPALLAEAAALGLNVVRTYGMSETAGGCVYDGAPLPGVDVQEDQGRLWIAGDMLADGYLGAPELTAERFAFHSGKRWFRTDDTGSVAADGTVSVSGRLDDVIVTGGVKVSGTAVAAAAEQLAEVREAVALGLEDPEWGAVVGIVVVGSVEADRLRNTIRSVLGAPAVPKVVVELERMPLLPGGKTDRVAIRRLLAAARG